MQLRFWVDPACPWCWLTSRWAVEVAPHRDVDIEWRSISLKVKNDTQPDSMWWEPVAHSHGLLRVMESLRASDGNGAVGAFYTAAGTQIHHDGERPTAEKLLAETGLDLSHAAAFDDETWDDAIHSSMAEGLALTGEDVGTPILGFVDRAGTEVGFFGPVISRRLPPDEGLALWDGLMTMAGTGGFWELKRTRTEHPDFTPAG